MDVALSPAEIALDRIHKRQEEVLNARIRKVLRICAREGKKNEPINLGRGGDVVMRKYVMQTPYAKTEDTLFNNQEAEPAEKILHVLSGMSIFDAKELLDKCKIALEQAPFTSGD